MKLLSTFPGRFLLLLIVVCSNQLLLANGQNGHLTARANLWFLQPWVWGVAAFILGMIVISALRGIRR